MLVFEKNTSEIIGKRAMLSGKQSYVIYISRFARIALLKLDICLARIIRSLSPREIGQSKDNISCCPGMQSLPAVSYPPANDAMMQPMRSAFLDWKGSILLMGLV